MVAFKEILVPTDFSEHSLRALDYAVEIAEKFSSELKLLYVIEPLLQAADVSWSSVNFEQLNKSHQQSAQEQLAHITAERIPKSVTFETKNAISTIGNNYSWLFPFVVEIHAIAVE